MSSRYFEDFAAGDTFESAGITVTESDIIDFALKYDPQPFHLDTEAAARSIYGGLIASGWQVGALAFRMFLQKGVFGDASLGSPGLDELRWLKPVRPGDTIRLAAEVVEVRPSSSRSDRGYVTIDYTALNQRDEPVMSMRGVQILARRPPAK